MTRGAPATASTGRLGLTAPTTATVMPRGPHAAPGKAAKSAGVRRPDGLRIAVIGEAIGVIRVDQLVEGHAGPCPGVLVANRQAVSFSPFSRETCASGKVGCR